jgi:iron(III) transport system ATP-binding protein
MRRAAMTTEIMLHGEGLTKSYGAQQVLSGVDLNVPRACFLVLLGPSGSGKTTLLRCISGTERLGAGSLWLGGKLIAGPRLHLPPERRALSMVFQDFALWPHMTVLENVGFALKRLRMSSVERRRKALAMLERVGLTQFAGQYPNQLSGGQQQRVALARALVAETPLLLCDEPLSNLDAHLREQVRVEIATLARDSGATVIYITHDQQEAFALADQVAIIHQGRILQLGTPEDVYRLPTDPFVAHFTGVAGSIQGEVVGHLEGRSIRVSTGDATLEATSSHPTPVGTQVDLLLRPDALHLVAPDSDGKRLVGVVRDTSFRSGAYEHVVDLLQGSRLTGVRSATRVARGSKVGITVDAHGCLAFAAGDDDRHRDLEVVASAMPSAPMATDAVAVP